MSDFVDKKAYNKINIDLFSGKDRSAETEMKNFENFKERLITTIVFRAKYLKQEIDVMKLINDFLKYYKENMREFCDDNSKGYYKARA